VVSAAALRAAVAASVPRGAAALNLRALDAGLARAGGAQP
jgi:hypothetical protein